MRGIRFFNFASCNPLIGHLLMYISFVFFIVTAFNGRCEPGWGFYGVSCYRLFYSRKSFADAQTSCESEEAALASISSAKENLVYESKCYTLTTIVLNIVNRFEIKFTIEFNPWRHIAHFIGDQIHWLCYILIFPTYLRMVPPLPFFSILWKLFFA